MKKKTYFETVIIWTLAFAVLLVSHLFLIFENKSLLRERSKLNDALIEQQSRINAEVVELQKLSSEERILRIAKNELGLKKRELEPRKISIDQNHISNIKEIVESKYE